jgi:hypothetical protein
VRRTIPVLLLALCVLSPAVAHAQWYPYPPPFPYRYYPVYTLRSAVRIEVVPKEAEVYVDGYYAGIVDDFNGTFQRLRLPPGQHEIVVRKDGFHTLKQDVYLTPDTTFRIRGRLEQLAAGHPCAPRPTPPPPPPGSMQPGGVPPGGAAPGEYPPPPTMSPGGGTRRPPARRMPPPQQQPPSAPESALPESSSFGTVVIHVQPGDAEILIDGERWHGPAGEERLVVQLPEGPHHVEIQKDGFQQFSGEVQVRRGETTPLNVSLARRE